MSTNVECTVEKESVRRSPASVIPLKCIVNSEYERRRTFGNWPKSYINTNELAMIGFYHLGGDAVKCAFCNICLRDWDERDSPLAEHLKYSSDCPLLNRQFTQNIPMDKAELNRRLPEISPDKCSEVTCEREHAHIDESARYEHTDYVLEMDRLGTFFSVPLSDSNSVQISTIAEDAKMADINKTRSFCIWPKSIRQTPQELVDAGFFYSEQGDMVICFSCGLALRDWESEDIPIEKHAKYTKECIYLNSTKGAEFVKDFQRYQSIHDQRNEIRKSTSKGSLVFEETDKTDSDSSTDFACKICNDNVNDILFEPCNHCVSCDKCAASSNTCPLCRQTVEKKTKIYRVR